MTCRGSLNLARPRRRVDHARGQGLSARPSPLAPQRARSALAQDASEVPPRAMSTCSDISHWSTFAELLRLPLLLLILCAGYHLLLL